jgi:hypothetical protein
VKNRVETASHFISSQARLGERAEMGDSRSDGWRRRVQDLEKSKGGKDERRLRRDLRRCEEAC